MVITPWQSKVTVLKTVYWSKTRIPLGYSLGWNGSFLNNRLLTRWSWGIEGEARHKYSRMLILGQKLNLDRLQWYFDIMYQNDGLDRFGLASREVRDFFPAVGGEVWKSDVHYTSFITKLNWQFAPQWNLMLKGMYETASVTKSTVSKTSVRVTDMSAAWSITLLRVKTSVSSWLMWGVR